MSQNKTIAIIGATGRTGKYVLSECLERGYAVRVLVRDASKIQPNDQITVIQGNVNAQQALEELIKGADILVSTLGAAKASDAGIVQMSVKNILSVLNSSSDQPKYIHMSAFGLGDSKEQCKKSLLWRFISSIGFKLIGQKLFDDMEVAESLVLASSGNFVVLRPSVLNEKPKQGYLVSDDKVGAMQISRLDVATFIVDMVESSKYDKKAVSLFSA